MVGGYYISGMEILNDFNINVVDESPIYRVEYSLGDYSGSCTYTETYPQSKLQSGTIFILTHSDMGDVIEYINKKTPLSSEKFNEVQMGIREHSLINLNRRIGGHQGLTL